MIEVLKHALAITSFVAVMMLVIEYVNVLTQGAWLVRLTQNQWGQYVLGAFLGATPGCLGAFAVVSLYMHGRLTHGAVIATMIATAGDESFVMLALIPREALVIFGILFVLGIAVGALSDLVARRWMPLTSRPCDGLQVHDQAKCHCYPRGHILEQWKDCSPARGILATALALFMLGLTAGQVGPERWSWIRVTLLLVSAVGLFIVITVPDHFLEEHLWEHVARRHVPRIFLWTLGALVAMHWLTEDFDVRGALERSRWLVLLIACLIGLIPESGPHLIFVTLFAQGLIPFGILLASSIVQDGHGMLPLLAHSRRGFVGVKLVSFIAGLLIGAGAMWMKL
ncbi:MAG: arsenic efflux protein [Verrucomicrobia bacterium]|nr:arsenic efflux protein [Verrucomicrobiota bacterium]